MIPIPHPGKTYCKVGAFHHVDTSRKDLGIPPQDFRTMSNATKLTLYLANQSNNIQASWIPISPGSASAFSFPRIRGESASTLGDLVYRRNGLTNHQVPARL